MNALKTCRNAAKHLHNTWRAVIPSKYRRGVLLFFKIFFYLLFGSLFYHTYEGWSPGTAIGFSVVTMSTVGYGYHSPSTDASRAFTIFFMLVGIFVVFGGINDVINDTLSAYREQKNKQMAKNAAQQSPAEVYASHRRQLIMTCSMIVALLFIGAFAFMGLEGWTFIKALYFAVETSTTVGYGDLPINSSTHVFLIFYILLSTILLAYGFSNIQTLFEERRQLLKAAEFTRKKQSLAKIRDMDKGQGVSMEAFILAVLEHLGTLDHEKDVEPWIEKFKEIDADGSGTIEAEEIDLFAAREAELAEGELQVLARTNTLQPQADNQNDDDEEDDKVNDIERAEVVSPIADKEMKPTEDKKNTLGKSLLSDPY